ncbi:MAG TPA: sulfite exporter TauE/SafE family protein [Fimbriimonadaceae bacterium]|nr:sulfite exporter TauE/SafE family protein [Fimbriimonadaceae bacterium]
MWIVYCIIIGLAAGVLGGLFGIGGGIIIVPALGLAFGFSQHKAQGTSLVALLAPVGLLALMNYYREGNADLVKGAWIAAAFFVGAFLGSKIALGLDEVMMRRGFALFLVAVAAYMFFKK